MSKHAIVPIFVPHVGCPQQCSFCDQRTISGQQEVPSPEGVRRMLQSAKRELGARCGEAEIAFFGGSFTAIEPAQRDALLEAAAAFVGDNGFSHIRVSTRPDAVGGAVLDQLHDAGVRVVELGAQSMDDLVLQRNRRGHHAADVWDSSGRIRAKGFRLGLQMMTGLPGDSDAGAMATARELAVLQPDFVRVYPALTLRGTQMERWYRDGSYIPPTLDETVELCADLLAFFADAGIPVIRLGLHDSDELRESLVAGPHHPALRELCESRLLLRSALQQLEGVGQAHRVELRVHPRSVSKMAGQRRENLKKLQSMGIHAKICPDSAQNDRDVLVRKV